MCFAATDLSPPHWIAFPMLHGTLTEAMYGYDWHCCQVCEIVTCTIHMFHVAPSVMDSAGADICIYRVTTRVVESTGSSS